MKDIVLVVVPAVIALALVFSVLYLTVFHPEQKTPEFLVNALATIMGYYFGIGVAKSS